DKRALWEHVARVMAVIRSAGVENLGVVTEAEELGR
ncbi:MAG: protein TolR, partial [Gemmatimonadetes bacterium]|nr:protein TolR [Gemmatimonadota bacterium]